MRRAGLALAALALLLPAWLLGTTSALRGAAALATQLTGGRLTIGDVDGRLLGEISLRDVAWRTATVSVEIDRADMILRLSRLIAGRVQAEQLAVGNVAVTTVAGPAKPATTARTPLTVRLPLWVAVESGRLATFRLRLAGWTRDWTITDATLEARWRDEWLVIGALNATTAESGPVQLRGRLALIEDLLQLQTIEATAGTTATVTAAGAVALGDAASSALDLGWRDLVLPRDLAPWLASRHGTARLEGPWRDYRWRAQARLEVQGVPAELDAHGRGNRQSLALQQADVRALAGTIRAQGNLAWSPRPATQLALEWERIDPGSVWPAWPGTLHGSARVQAQRGAVLELAFDGALRDSKLRGYPIALQAAGRTEDRKVFLKEFSLHSGPSTLVARGQLLPDMALSGELRSTDLRSLWAGLSGTADLRATAAGPFAAPRLTARGAVGDLQYGAARLVRATIDADVNFAAQRASRVAVAVTTLEAGALKLRSLTLSGSGTRQAHHLQVVAQARKASARLAVTGGAQGRGWRGSLAEASVQPPEGDSWALEEPAALAFASGRFAMAPTCLAAGANRACAELTLSRAEQRVALRTRDFDLALVKAWLPPEWSLVGMLSGTAALRLAGGELRELRADLAATAGSIDGGGVKLEYGPGTLNVGPDDGRLHAQLVLRPAGGEVNADLWITPGSGLLDRPMLGDLRLRMPDLAWMPVLSPEIAGAQGALSADLHVSGSVRSPSLDGKVNLTNGRVQLTTPGIELTNLEVAFERGRNAPLLLHAQANSGDGQFRIEGEFQTLQPKLTGGLTVKGENVLGFNRTDIRAWLSPDLKLAIDGTTARLSGQLGVPRAEITPREIDGRGIGPSGDQIIVESEAGGAGRPGLKVLSEVSIVLGDDVRFDGLGLKTKLTGQITALDDAQQATRGRGELRLEGGRYKAYGQELEIETGRLIFNGGPITDPVIDVTAVRKPREDIKVGLRARGRPAAPEFSLFSEPAMSQEEQLSWLVLGRSLSGTLDSGQRTELSSAAMSLGLTGGSYLAGRLAPRLGVDEVTLGAKPGEAADLARLTIGKYLSPKLFVSYGYGLFQPGHFFRMQYDVGKRLKLVGESGVQQGGDVLYTIER